MNGNITTAPLGGNRNIKTKPLFQYDYGQVLKIIGVTLPAAYEVHFSNQLHGVATTQIGNADGVIIPNIYLTTGEPVYAWIYLHTGNSDGETEYTITIPVVRRASISDAEPTPVQQDAITQAIAALNTAVEQTAQDVQDATEAKQDAEEAAGEAYESAVTAGQYATTAGGHAADAAEASHNAEYQAGRADQAHLDAQAAQWAAESAQTAAEAAQAGAVAARTGAETAQAWAVAARSGAEAAQHAAEAARDEITGLSATANTLPAGSQATASYSNGLLTIGVPKGEKGDTGDTGATPDFAIGTVSTLPAGSEATATITGTPEEPVLNLGIPKGDQGEVSQAEFDALSDTVDDMQDTIEHKADIDGYYTDMTVGAAEQVVSSTMVEDNAPYKLRTSGGSTDIGNRAYVDKIVGGTVAWNQAVRDEASENVTEYADIVTVTDAVEDDAAVSVRVEPVQDLHGYDSPWPAGGGKNLFDKSNTVQGLWKPEGTFESNSSYVTIYCNVLPNTTYTLSGQHWDSKRMCYFNSYEPQTFTYRDAGTASTFTTGADTVMISFSPSATSYGDGDGVQLELGSAATSFAPYSNICPITGFDKVEVWDDSEYGGNINWNQMIQHGNFDTDAYWYKYNANFTVANGIASVTPTDSISRIYMINDVVLNHKYLMHAEFKGTLGKGNATLSWYGGVNQFVPFTGDWQKVDLLLTNTFQTASNWQLYYGSSSNNENTEYQIRNAMCFDLTQMFGEGNEPSTVEGFKALFPADYYPDSDGEITTVGAVNGNPYRHYSITLPTEAGTVYGGELTVNKDGTGSLVVDRAKVILDEDTSPDVLGITVLDDFTQVSYVPYISAGTVGHNFVASSFRTGGINGLYRIWGTSVVPRMFMGLPVSVTTAAEAVAWFAENPTEVVYPLATPITYTLTASQVQTLLGTNHVWSDAGQIALTYTGTDEHLTLTTGRKYLTRINGTDSMVLGAGQEVTAAKGTDNVFDMTQMFGTAVADYVYQQGAGYFRRWFGGSHYAYNAGELISVQGVQSREIVGFNQWDEEWELGLIAVATGMNVVGNGIRSKGMCMCIPNTAYYANIPYTYSKYIFWYDASGEFISVTSVPNSRNVTSPSDACYFRIRVDTIITYNHDICINLSNSGTRNGTYEPYTHRSYPLDSTLTLRGIPKVGASGVYWDGDEYGYDGGVKRRYGVVDLGSLTWTQGSFAGITGYYTQAPSDIKQVGNGQAFSGQTETLSIIRFNAISTMQNAISLRDNGLFYVNSEVVPSDKVVYELATSTTETATPYQHIQNVDDWGTEEFVSTSIVPVGHQSRYPQNLRDKLQHLPALASANGSYIITQTNGQMVLTPFPAPPTAAGNYLLKATVSGGNATYSWVAQ